MSATHDGDTTVKFELFWPDLERDSERGSVSVCVVIVDMVSWAMNSLIRSLRGGGGGSGAAEHEAENQVTLHE